MTKFTFCFYKYMSTDDFSILRSTSKKAFAKTLTSTYSIVQYHNTSSLDKYLYQQLDTHTSSFFQKIVLKKM